MVVTQNELAGAYERSDPADTLPECLDAKILMFKPMTLRSIAERACA
jgi:hypothetical protein